MTDFFKDIIKDSAIKDISFASDGDASSESSGCIDTGSYILNAALSGSLYGGAYDNRVTTFTGEEATGKTFFILGIIRQWLIDNPTGAIFFFDSEAAVTKQMLEDRGIDSSRFIIVEPVTVQDFRHQALSILDNYLKTKESDRPPMAFALDSLGQLSTTKEIEDTAEGKETRDMTRSQVIKATFRVLNLKLAKSKVPLFCTNHVYDVIGSMIPQKVMSGGSGLKYTASQIAFLTKAKDKDGQEVKGNIITVTMAKNRFAKENVKVKVRLSYETGLDRYYGLLPLAEEYGIIKKVSTRYEMPDGTKAFEKSIYKDPEKYFTDDIMKKLEVAANDKFMYGSAKEEEFVEDSELE